MSSNSNTEPWPWKEARWEKRREGVKKIILETQNLVERDRAKREATNLPSNDLYFLPKELRGYLTSNQEYDLLEGFKEKIYQKQVSKKKIPNDSNPEKCIITTKFYDKDKKEIGQEITTQILGSKGNVISQSSHLIVFTKEKNNRKVSRPIVEENNRINKCIELLGRLEEVIIDGTFEKLQQLSQSRRIKSDDFSLNFIYRTLLNQISIDLNIIHQALQQRRLSPTQPINPQSFVKDLQNVARFLNQSAGNSSVESVATEKIEQVLRSLRLLHETKKIQPAEEQPQFTFTLQGYVLYIADKLASHAIEPAIIAGTIPTETTVLTYLQDSIDVRLVPYHDVILLSIPYSTIDINPIELGGTWFATDYLAIPHEIGHHLFWHGHIPDSDDYILEKLAEKLMKNGEINTKNEKNRVGLIKALEGQDWRMRWLEEIFADAYGCIIAGPISILSFQELLTYKNIQKAKQNNNKPQIIPENSDHPIPELRPLIQTEIMRRAISSDLLPKNIGDLNSLDGNWQEWASKKWGIQNLLEKEYRFGGTELVLTGAQIRDSLGDVIEAILKTLKETLALSQCKPWTTGFESPDTLYEDFTSGRFISELLKTQSKKQTRQTAGIESRKRQKPRLDRFKLDAKSPVELTKEMVGEMLFNGWATKGPEDSHGGL